MSEIVTAAIIGLPLAAARKNEEMKKNMKAATFSDDVNEVVKNEQIKLQLDAKNAQNGEQKPVPLPAPGRGDTERDVLEKIAGFNPKGNSSKDNLPLGAPTKQKSENRTTSAIPPIPNRVTPQPAPRPSVPLR